MLIEELVENYSIVTIHGCREIYIQNYLTILELNQTLIKIKAIKELIIIEGKNLRVEYMNKDDIKVMGILLHINFREVSL